MKIKKIQGKLRYYAKRIDYHLYINTRYERSRKGLASKLKSIEVTTLTKEQKIAIDTIWKGRKFDYGWFEFYNSLMINSHHKPLEYPIEWYIPNDYFYAKIDPYFNKIEQGRALDDKNIYDLLFKGVNQPQTIGRIIDGVILDADYKTITKKSLLDACVNSKTVIFKPSIGTVGGKGISFWDNSIDSTERLIEIIEENKNAIIQEVVKQSTTLAQLHPLSLQTIRIMTMYSAGKAEIVSSVLRMGQGNAKVDNVCAGGIAVGIDEMGSLRKYAYNVNGIKFEKHPTTDVEFEGIQIPNFIDCCNLVKSLAPRLGRTQRLISWDISLDINNTPVLIEANLTYGQLDFHQMCNGPLFKEKIVQILKTIKE